MYNTVVSAEISTVILWLKLESQISIHPLLPFLHMGSSNYLNIFHICNNMNIKFPSCPSKEETCYLDPWVVFRSLYTLASLQEGDMWMLGPGRRSLLFILLEWIPEVQFYPVKEKLGLHPKVTSHGDHKVIFRIRIADSWVLLICIYKMFALSCFKSLNEQLSPTTLINIQDYATDFKGITICSH